MNKERMHVKMRRDKQPINIIEVKTDRFINGIDSPLLSNNMVDICRRMRMTNQTSGTTIEDLLANHSYDSLLKLTHEEEEQKLPTLKRINNYIEVIYSSIKHSIYHLDEIEKDIQRLNERSEILRDDKIYDLTQYCIRNPEDKDAEYEMLELHCISEGQERNISQELSALKDTKFALIGNIYQTQTIQKLVETMEKLLGFTITDEKTYTHILSDAIKGTLHQTRQNLEELSNLQEEKKHYFDQASNCRFTC